MGKIFKKILLLTSKNYKVMKKNTLKQLLVFVAFLALAASVSSCNKGYGCPTNFKAVKVVNTAIQLVK